jgi:hypothetical protein
VTSAKVLVSIRQHTSAYVSIRQHTSAYVSICTEESSMASTNVLNCPHTCVNMCACILLGLHMRAPYIYRERRPLIYTYLHLCILGGAEAAGHMARILLDFLLYVIL